MLVCPWCLGRCWSASRLVVLGRVSWVVYRGLFVVWCSFGVVFRVCARLRGPLGGNSKADCLCSRLAAIFVVLFLFSTSKLRLL